MRFYEIIEKMGVSYKLKFLKSFRFHNVFRFNSLRLIVNDSLFDQRQELFKLVMISKSEEWELDDILKS